MGETVTARYLKPASVAAYCDVSVDTVYRWAKAGKLSKARVMLNGLVRYDRQALDDLVAGKPAGLLTGDDFARLIAEAARDGEKTKPATARVSRRAHNGVQNVA